ncbi:MAG: STAS domain-containing protein [Actinomycetota bacterium]|nr:STAS domain-containing protein [Actinomycetota bacterium]
MAALGEIDVEVELDGSTTVVGFAGEIDLVTAPKVRTTLSEAIERDGLQLLVLDMSEVSFLDSTGIAAVAFAIRMSSAEGVTVRLCCIQAHVLRVLEITGLAEHWDLFASRTAAAAG